MALALERPPPRAAKPVLAVLAVLAALAALLAALAPVLAKDGGPWAQAMAILGPLALGRSCHQIPARCLVIGGVAAGLCARCMGLALGVLLAGVGSTRLPGMGRARARSILVLTAFPMLVDVALQAGGVYFSNSTRLATGLLCGAGACAAALGLAVHEEAG